MNDSARAGAIVGGVLGILLLGVASVWLLGIEGSGPKVLIAVWLWLLPILGATSALGWAIGWAGGRAWRHGS